MDLVTTARGEPLAGTPTGGGKSSYAPHEPASEPAIFTGCATPVAGRPASSLWTLLIYYKWEHAGTSRVIGYWPLTWSAGTIYISGVGAARGHRESRVATMLLYYTRSSVRWVGGVHCGDMEATKAEGQARLQPPRNPGYASTGYCMLAVGYMESGVVGIRVCAAGVRGVTGDGCLHAGGGTQTKRPRLASPHACCFVHLLLLCTHRRRRCFLLVAVLLRCYALPLYPRRTKGPVSVAIANANALQLPVPQKHGWPPSPVLWVLCHAVGHLRQPWDPRHRARQEPQVGAKCPATPVDGMISGYDYDYDYIYIYIYIRGIC